MNITLPLFKAVTDDNRMSGELEQDFKNFCEIRIFKDEKSWKEDEDTHVYSLWIEYAKSKKFLMFEADLNDLEMFAHSLTKSIEMLRRDYSDVLKNKIKNNADL